VTSRTLCRLPAAVKLARPGADTRLVVRLPRPEPQLVLVVAVYVVLWALVPQVWIAADSWLTFLGGREILAHGIPHTDALAALTSGDAWIDQQWLAQVFFFGVFRIGGPGLAAAVSLAAVVAAFPVAFAVARRRGAPSPAIVVFALLPILAFTTFVRAQVLSPVLFVLVLAILSAESRRRSRSVLLVFPLLVLWANVHGAVTVGALLVSLLGVCEVAALARASRRTAAAWLRAAALLVLPWLCLVATPYRLQTLAYYRSTMTNPAFRELESEWQAPALSSPNGIVLALLALLALALVVRRRRDLTLFELGALAATFVGAVLAVRSIPWFGWACLVLVPALARRRRCDAPTEPPRRDRIAAGVAWLSAGAALVAVAALALTPASRFGPTGAPRAAARAVADAVRRDPGTRVFAAERYADWLLFEEPSLRGRVAFDGRFELLPPDRMRAVVAYLRERGDAWERPSRGYRIVVLDTQDESRLVATYDRRPGMRVLYRGGRIVVYDRGPSAS
jgi:hypothetical protein